MAIGSKITGLVALLPAETKPPHISMSSSKVSLSSLRSAFANPSLFEFPFQGPFYTKEQFCPQAKSPRNFGRALCEKGRILVCKCFVNSVLDSNVHITSVIRLHDSLGELGQ